MCRLGYMIPKKSNRTSNFLTIKKQFTRDNLFRQIINKFSRVWPTYGILNVLANKHDLFILYIYIQIKSLTKHTVYEK